MIEKDTQLKGAIQAASYNIVLQVLFRIQTFVLNAFILRYISRDILGIINVRLFLLYSSILFLSKEAFRNACLSNTREHQWSKVINLLWLTVPSALLTSVVFGYIWINVLEQPEAELRPAYVCAVLVVCASCVVEMAAEPLIIVARIFLFNKLMVVNESISIGLRCLTLALTVFLKPQLAIYGFAVGQVIYSVAWTAGMYGYFAFHFHSRTKNDKMNRDLKKSGQQQFPFNSLRDFLPKKLENEPSFSSEQVALTWTFYKQGFLKQILTEGERVVMTLLDVLTFAEQGIFDVVNNLGSMAARFIFRPIEDSSYQFFAGLVKRDVSANQQDQDVLKLTANVLHHLLKAMILLGCVVVAFGYAYSHLLLHLYGGSILSVGIGPILLRWHCVYVLFLAVNGITECYAFATMSKQDVEKYNLLMVAFSIGFLLLSWYLTKMFGSVGFLLANCANMLLRITYSCNYINRFYKGSNQSPLTACLPDPLVLALLGASFILTSASEKWFCCDVSIFYNAVHVVVGGLCLLIVCAAIYLREKEFIQFVSGLIRNKKIV